ncbi:hypothetical protein HID58_074314 [Brassica napus]|uniref:Uncharacterized protein n=1 Tax=Brassica napus TaxID=3708 RepID=A0ABQ7YGK5_BRANA|nr:hypothetical protein HID58_074314 [Brassica napus]
MALQMTNEEKLEIPIVLAPLCDLDQALRLAQVAVGIVTLMSLN